MQFWAIFRLATKHPFLHSHILCVRPIMRGMPGKIPRDFIDRVVARTDLVELIDRRVPLTRKG
ncbi:MAG: hypothetical protein MPL62_17345, partial [Alphaproteobacteria bacterium]|nr:hypothetical protein [Alphaproteobacteria bacterium]